MGKGLIWLGNKLLELKAFVQCKWNKVILSLMFKKNDCPNKICNCK